MCYGRATYLPVAENASKEPVHIPRKQNLVNLLMLFRAKKGLVGSLITTAIPEKVKGDPIRALLKQTEHEIQFFTRNLNLITNEHC